MWKNINWEKEIVKQLGSIHLVEVKKRKVKKKEIIDVGEFAVTNSLIIMAEIVARD